ncbi:MAG: putative lipid II flippase FtsW [Sporichthyaceae bacterium]
MSVTDERATTGRVPPQRSATAPVRPKRVRATALRRALDRPLAPYYLVLTAGLLLVALGLVMVLSASSVESYRTSGSVFSIAAKQAMWIAVGLPLMWITSRMPVSAFRRLAFPAVLISLALLALVLVPGIGKEVNGNRNWIYLGGPAQIQPSEAAKLALVIFGAHILARKHKLLGQWSHLMIPLAPASAAIIFMVLLGGDLGTTIVLLAIVLALLYFAGTPMRFFAVIGVLALGLVLMFIVAEPYRMQRVSAFMDPFATYHDSGWQGAQSIFALASGGLTGVGLGASREKWGYLPEAHTDFIYAIIGEELGLVGAVGVLALFGAIVIAGFRIAARSRDMFVTLSAAAITAWIAVQALVNIGAVLGVLPITGIPLPLVSYGGSALLPIMVALGMLLSFARREVGAAAALAARGPGPLRRSAAWLYPPRRERARNERGA